MATSGESPRANDGDGRARPVRAPLSRRVIMVGGAVLLLSLLAATLDARRNRPGRLTLRRNGHDVRIVVRRDGRVVLPGTTERFVTLLPGTYDLSLEDEPPGLRVAPSRVTIAPAGEADASVEAAPSGPAR
ncbi:MAG: hypothetical protein U0835_26620 [Isosphaeraceae bacterium]